jgi:hypothetical protein
MDSFICRYLVDKIKTITELCSSQYSMVKASVNLNLLSYQCICSDLNPPVGRQNDITYRVSFRTRILLLSCFFILIFVCNDSFIV